MILITELMMLAMTLHVARYVGFSRRQKAWYLITFISVMFTSASEFISLKYGGAGSAFVIPMTVMTAVEFTITPMLPVFFAGALGMHKEAKIAGLLFGLNGIAEFISVFNGWIFYYDETSKYFRGEFYLIYEISYVVSMVFLIVSMFFVGRRYKKRDAVTVVMIVVVMAAGVLPLILGKIYTDYLGIGISACMCYIYYNDLVQQDNKRELVLRQKKLTDMQDRIISGMANIIENRDIETGGHVSRTSAYVKTLAEDARKDGVYKDLLTDRFTDMLYMLAPMHDIGKISISDEILKKPGRLTAEEYEEMKKHASAGGALVRSVLNGITDEEYVMFAADIATYHHERWDGKGYPEGLSGEDIPLSARITAFADVFDALVSKRCYKEPVSADEAFRIIEEESGSHFDPNLAKVFISHKEDFIKIMNGSAPESLNEEERGAKKRTGRR